MPFGDGSGPNGMGPMSGRAMGNCAGNTVPGRFAGGMGRGMRFGGGMGRGIGRGAGRGFGGRGWPYFAGQNAPQAQAGSELDFLRREAADLHTTLDEINKRISELEKDNK